MMHDGLQWMEAEIPKPKMGRKNELPWREAEIPKLKGKENSKNTQT